MPIIHVAASFIAGTAVGSVLTFKFSKTVRGIWKEILDDMEQMTQDDIDKAKAEGVYPFAHPVPVAQES